MYSVLGSNETVLYGVHYAIDNWDRYGPEIDEEFPGVGKDKAEAAIRYLRDNFEELSRTTQRKFQKKLD